MVKLLAEHAPAKINLYLRITGKRADGYHELDSIFLPITWSDAVRLETRPADMPGVALHCDRPGLDDPGSNLASRAALSFMREFAINAAVLIDLRKRIPMGAGLGGGSSDAGAVLRMMARIFRVPATSRLTKLAVELGADVPFFLDPRPARVRGIGEQIEPLPPMPPLHLVVAVPAVEVPTAAVFKDLKREEWSGPLPDSELASIQRGEISAIHTINDLSASAIRRAPAIASLKALLEEEGARPLAMSGSGGAVFGLYADAEAAWQAAVRVGERAPGAAVRAVSTTTLEELAAAPFST
ncbi:MAG TPA: 4-(cytidine 5'-diphospho)-2-C-methyl-D-erythritol kinase [Candidatus Binataceae bacterium]|nr:4-(cytidine 5'-diphospho)-2-C-methyl-D-erythritol kinase [Candidatus Binataceae bacterium]